MNKELPLAILARFACVCNPKEIGAAAYPIQFAPFQGEMSELAKTQGVDPIGSQCQAEPDIALRKRGRTEERGVCRRQALF